ncbi:MAG: PAS domain-containing protein [Chloroflexi bacterium]|nr:PAS domain-containing protein [Chloroflexota bacterium]
MEWQFTPAALLYAAAFVVSLGLGVYGWRMRAQKGAPIFTLMILASAFWSLGYLFGFFSATPAWKLTMLRVEYLGITAAPVLWVLFVLVYANYEQPLKPRTIALVSLIPAVMMVLVLFVQRHPLIYQSYDFVQVGNLLLFQKEYGVGFWIFAGYQYILTFAGSVLLLVAVVRFPSLFQRQAALLTAAALMPILVNVLYITGNNPIAPYDPSPVAFVLTGSLVAVTIWQYRLLDVVPVAHHLVFESVSNGVIIFDAKGAILEVNPAAEGILKQSEQAVLGKALVEAFPKPLDPLATRDDSKTVKSEVTIDDAIYELQITPIRERGEEFSGHILMLYDVTEQRRLIKELDAYARTVAHDLKSPISTIYLYAQMLLMNEEQWDSRSLSFIKRIERGALKTSDIVDSLLLLARLRQDEQVVRVPVDMDEVIDAVQGRLADVIEDSGAEICVPDGLPGAIGFPSWVEEMWVNYVSNALKYGGKPPKVEIGAEARDGLVRYWVKDNGKGLTAEEQADLFEEFARLEKHKHAVDGHGLGLSIVKRIATRLGGEVGCESVIGQGSTFWFTLPSPSPSAETSTGAKTVASLEQEAQGVG